MVCVDIPYRIVQTPVLGYGAREMREREPDALATYLLLVREWCVSIHLVLTNPSPHSMSFVQNAVCKYSLITIFSLSAEFSDTYMWLRKEDLELNNKAKGNVS